MEETTTTDNPFEENTQANQGVKWLLTHAWSILKETSFKGRISRGEYWISAALLGTITSIIYLVLGYLGTVGMVISIFVSIIGGFYGLSFLTRRMHDFDKGWKWFFLTMLKGLGIVIGLFILINFIFYVLNLFVSAQDITSNIAISPNPQTQSTSIIGAIKSITNRLLGLAALFVFLYPTLIAYFKKGTLGDNSYGVDRLPNQPTSNGVYWGVGIGLVIISTIFSSINPANKSQNNTLEQMIQQQIGTQTNNTTNYPQINIDDSMSNQDIADQIDTGIQAEDAAALGESKPVDNTTTEATETIN